MITHRFTTTVTSDNSPGNIQGVQVEVGNSEINVTVPIPAGSTDYPIPLSWMFEAMQSIVLRSDKNCLVSFMAGTHPIASVSLVAGVPYTWGISTNYSPCPFNADPAWLEVTAVGACALQILILLNL